MNERFLWIDYNLPFEYTNPEDLAMLMKCSAELMFQRKDNKKTALEIFVLCE